MMLLRMSLTFHRTLNRFRKSFFLNHPPITRETHISCPGTETKRTTGEFLSHPPLTTTKRICSGESFKGRR